MATAQVCESVGRPDRVIVTKANAWLRSAVLSAKNKPYAVALVDALVVIDPSSFHPAIPVDESALGCSSPTRRTYVIGDSPEANHACAAYTPRVGPIVFPSRQTSPPSPPPATGVPKTAIKSSKFLIFTGLFPGPLRARPMIIGPSASLSGTTQDAQQTAPDKCASPNPASHAHTEPVMCVRGQGSLSGAAPATDGMHR